MYIKRYSESKQWISQVNATVFAELLPHSLFTSSATDKKFVPAY